MGRIISKKQIRHFLGYSNRNTFIKHLENSGIKDKLPAFFWKKNTYFEAEIQALEEVFMRKF